VPPPFVLAERLIISFVVFGSMLAGASRASANERSQRPRGGREPSGDVYNMMRIAYPAAFLAMLLEGPLRGTTSEVRRAGRCHRLPYGEGAEVVGDRFAGTLLDVPRGRGAGARLVAAGPYRWLRHPNYAGLMGELMSVALMTAAPVSGVAGIVTFGWLVIRRVSVEERALREAAR
jgi:isoprenylcysteine carboxyl methyltransferase (ICMT) family protein YpbQ